MNRTHQSPGKKDSAQRKMSFIGKSAYLLFSGATSALIALLSVIFIFALISLLTSGGVSGVIIPEEIPLWGKAVILLVAYIVTVLPLKSVRFKFSPREPYSLYGANPIQKYGDATLWLALFILFAWYASEHKTEIYASLGNFPAWWRNFVDTVGPWFYR